MCIRDRYSGGFRTTEYIWQTWHDVLTDFCADSEISVTHFGACSESFGSGKYLQYRRGKKRLFAALEARESFRYLSFVEMPGPFSTIAGDCQFHATLAPRDLQVDIQLDKHDEDLMDGLSSVSAALFQSSRLITFKTRGQMGNLPCNLSANYDRDPSIAEDDDYIDVETTFLQPGK